MAEAYIVDAVRTPVGKRNGGLAKVHPADLGAHALQAAAALPAQGQYGHQPPLVLLYNCSIISLLTVITRELAW